MSSWYKIETSDVFPKWKIFGVINSKSNLWVIVMNCFQLSYDMLVHNLPCNIGMSMGHVLISYKIGVIIEGIPTIEELGDILSNIEIDQESTSWMRISKVRQIYNHIIKKNQLFTSFDSGVKFFLGDEIVRLIHESVFLIFSNLENNFKGHKD